MGKNVFRANEVKLTNDYVQLHLSKSFVPDEPEEAVVEIPEYEGPTADDLRREAEQWKAEWELEKERMIAAAEQEAQRIVDEAEKAAFEEVKRKTDQSQILRQEAQDSADELLASARREADEILSEAKKRVDEQEKNGYEEGFAKAAKKASVKEISKQNGLSNVFMSLLNAPWTSVRNFSETEQQIVDLVLLMTRKIVKVISENQRNVVVSNVIQALRKVKGRGDVIIRVNLNDVGMTTQHTKDFLSAAENVKNITVVEDSSVDRGGCVIETDFGAIDARIVSQLNELEQRILEVSPIKTRLKTATTTPQD